MRQLATLETITAVAPIPDADAIVRARIRGWDVVVKRGEFAVGDHCVYFEIDSLLDVSDSRFAFLASRGVRTDATGRQGHVLRTVRLRGQYSQGLALPVAAFPEAAGCVPGDDLTERLGVVVYEAPIPASLSGVARGMLPSWIPKTDEERVQNRGDLLDLHHLDWVATEKIDGASMSVYVDPVLGPVLGPGPAGVGVCSRNLDLHESETNTMWRVARRLDLHARLMAEHPGRRVVVQGEVYGEGIQGNPLKVSGQHWAAFGLLVEGQHLPRTVWPTWLRELSVPVYEGLVFPRTVQEALTQVEGLASRVAAHRAAEGVVWVAYGPAAKNSFKVISNTYLLKTAPRS